MSASEKAALLPTLAVPFVVGLVLGERWDIPFGALALFLAASLFLAALSFLIRRSALPALALTALLLGLLRAGWVEPPGAELSPYRDTPRIELRGVVSDDPAGSDTILTFRLSTELLRLDNDSRWREVSGDVRVTARVPTALAGSRDAPFIRYGDRLALTGVLQAPGHFGAFDFPAYLESQGIGTVMRFPDAELIGEDSGAPFYRWLYSLRRDMARAMSTVIPEPQASFGQAILLGIRDTLPDTLNEDFRRAGTAHLLAISGLHVGILLALSISASEFLIGRRRQIYLVLPLLAIWMYALISGASDSAIRAAVMGTVYIVAIAVGRPRSLIPALALAASLMAAFEPRVLTRVSFQLSFAAMMGIAIYYEILSDRITEWIGLGPEREDWRATSLRGLAGAVGVTVAATLATAPLVMFYFERVSLVGLPATLLSMPALPLALVAHGATSLVGMVSETAALPFGWIAWILSGYITGISSLFSGLPMASVETGELARGFVWVYYSVVTGIVVLLYSPIRWRRPRLRLSSASWNMSVPWQIPVLALVIAVVVWTVALSRPEGMLKVVFADVGQGDMTIITTPSGQTIVVDGGPDPERAVQVLDAQMPFWKRTLSLVVLSHPHSDHISGLSEILRRYDVEHILESRSEYESADYMAWSRLTESESAQFLEPRPGTRLSFPGGVEVHVLGPPDATVNANDASVVVRVVYGNASFLLTGDVFRDGERWLLGSGHVLDSDVLKVAHHGSDTSSSAPFLGAVSPRAAVISAGQDNRFGHPDPEVVERLEGLMPPSRIFKTFERGTITFETDGSALSVKTER
ncbi:MAG: DNA internalization-related competence protein ComEC/Rec2 [Dehalococcoidia bacterium]|nr:DNA internalization-related competence protein ComEC/Rec2 [Dehalococcoidia bacterium]